ncbi:MAG TPA: response regulator [Firmicutes bacterium]|nr:response regulator [Bacillota bacterium]
MTCEYQVLLVDDEPLALEGVKTSVEWGDLGFRIAGECSDGEEAFSFIKKYTPDLVITDVRMPSLDGLNLIEQVIEYVNPKTKFIVISGYDDFSYAQRALKYQVNHYLLKPVFPEEMIPALQEIREHLNLLNFRSRLEAELNQAGWATGETTIFPQVSTEDLRHLTVMISYLDAMHDAIEELDPEKMTEAMETILSYLENQGLSLEIGRMFALNLMYHSNRIISEMEGSPSVALRNYDLMCIKQQTLTMEELKHLLREYVKEFFTCVDELRKKNSKHTIFQIEEYIKENYQRNLTIKEIAKVFYMHPAYIGQVFLKTFGVSFQEYLHQLRIDEAKNLIEKGFLRIHEVAEEVGYNNYHSFLENFKKYIGCKPVEYMERIGRG